MCIIVFLWIVFWYAHKRKRKRKFSQYWLIGDFWAVMEKLGGQFSVFFPSSLFSMIGNFMNIIVDWEYMANIIIMNEKNTRDRALF